MPVHLRGDPGTLTSNVLSDPAAFGDGSSEALPDSEMPRRIGEHLDSLGERSDLGRQLGHRDRLRRHQRRASPDAAAPPW